MPTTGRSTPRRRPQRADAPPAADAAALQANKLGVLWSTLDLALAGARGDWSPTSAALLLWLLYQAPCGVVQIARVVGLSQPASSRAVDALVAAGLVDKQPAGGKEVSLALTRAGAREAQALQQARLAACDRLLQALSAPERQALDPLLDRLVRAPVTDRDYARQVCRFCDHRTCDGPRCPVGCQARAIEAGTAVPPSEAGSTREGGAPRTGRVHATTGPRHNGRP